jgi:hypothetical protein
VNHINQYFKPLEGDLLLKGLFQNLLRNGRWFSIGFGGSNCFFQDHLIFKVASEKTLKVSAFSLKK